MTQGQNLSAYPFLGVSTPLKPMFPGMDRAGLRGAVGLSLSLFVLLDRQISDTRFRSLAVFFMGAQALLTLVIQGTTMPWLLQARPPSRVWGWG